MNVTKRAEKIGAEHGKSAASWVFDGSTSEDTYRYVLAGIESGDPEVMDAYRVPDLSGEWADSYDLNDLADELGIDQDSENLDDAATAWLDAASEAFWAEVERIARLHVGPDPADAVARRRDGIAYLLKDGHLRVPCSRYGRWTSDCAPVAWRLAYLVARETGEPITYESLDHAMGLVVNDNDDVAYVIRTYGHRQYT
jgi:hypothetical protein